MPHAPLLLASLMPESASDWLAGQGTWLLMLICVFAMAIVIKGADWLVEGAAGIAKKFGMPEVVVGATIVSLGTTSPEAAVSVLAAFSGDAGLAIGNGVGSIIADTGLIFGVGCLLTRLPADKFVLSRQGWVQVGSAVILAGLCYFLWATRGDDATIQRWAGVAFTLMLVGYLIISVKWAKAHPSGEPHVVAEPDGTVHSDRDHAERGLGVLLGMGVGGLALVIASGDVLVTGVTALAEEYGIPDAVIASTIVALGTSLPELVTGITAIRKGHPELLVGNVIGADILNVLFVIGVSALAAPLPLIDETAKRPDVILTVMLPAMLLMLFYMRGCIFAATRRGHFSRWMGAPLVASYVAYLVVSYAVSA
ncbi:MAG: sodium:calcium antiporter [Planctomycetota bacterium]